LKKTKDKEINQFAYTSYATNIYPYLKENLDFVTRVPQKREVYKNRVFLNGLMTYRDALFFRNKKLKDCQGVVDDFLESH